MILYLLEYQHIYNMPSFRLRKSIFQTLKDALLRHNMPPFERQADNGV